MDSQEQYAATPAQLVARQARRALGVPAVRYAGAGFVLGVLATRRLRRLTGRTRRWSWQSAAVEAVTLALTLREMGAELDAYRAEREIGSRRGYAMIDARSDPSAPPRSAIATANEQQG
ncbi:MAG: hypothetical protein ACRDMV_11770 [Streptosporangiales bacterium]